MGHDHKSTLQGFSCKPIHQVSTSLIIVHSIIYFLNSHMSKPKNGQRRVFITHAVKLVPSPHTGTHTSSPKMQTNCSFWFYYKLLVLIQVVDKL